MRRFSYAASRVGGFFSDVVIVLLCRALPPASGLSVKPIGSTMLGRWACFIQGEEDVRNGVIRPHYVDVLARERRSAA